MLLSHTKPETQPPIPKEREMDHRHVVRGILVGRGEEVLEAARRYYPTQIHELEKKLAELVQQGRLKGPVSGEELYSFLRRLGFDFSLDIKIRVQEGGKLKSLEEKFREKEY